jgi:hypothetical protein
MLALTNIDGSLGGSYSVVVSNSGGSVTSSPAILAVSTSNAPASLMAASGQSGLFEFQLTGETGRNYRMESSPNLAGWTNDYAFPRTPYYPYYSEAQKFPYSPYLTSIVFNTNSVSTFVFSNNVPCQFLRASQYAPANEICVNNLRQIRFAKLLWGRDRINPDYWRMDTPIGLDLAPYFPQGILPCCPEDPEKSFPSSYYPDNLQSVPACLIDATHLLEEPQ